MSTRTVTAQEAEKDMHKLLTWVSDGDEVFIVENSKLLAKIIPAKSFSEKRIFGKFAGKITISDDFDAPISNDFWLGESAK